MDAKKQALKDMMSMLKGEKQKKMKVMVAGDSPKAVKEGLDVAEDVVEEAPKMPGMIGKPDGMGMQMGKPESEASPKIDGIMMSLSPEEKKALLEKLMADSGGEDEEKNGAEMPC